LHRLNIASQDLDREETRAKDRIAELDLRLVQFAATASAKQRLAADAQAALARLAAEEETIPPSARKCRPPQRHRRQGGAGRRRAWRCREDFLRSDDRARRPFPRSATGSKMPRASTRSVSPS